MRVLSLVYRHEFEFTAQTVNNALAFGDLDNDGYDEFAIGNNDGEVLIFKGRQIWQKFTKLGCITCLAIGDILNEGRNCLVVVTGDGFCHIYDRDVDPESSAIEASEEIMAGVAKEGHVVHIHTQRVPANVKDILLGDIDGDGRIEMVLGLTDRVVRSYRWSSGGTPRPSKARKRDAEKPKLIALNKWECAKQIGSITLHHNREGKPSILVAQPGGTFMRIRCHTDGSPSLNDTKSTTRGSSPSENAQQSTVDYQSLGLSRMRSQEIATEIVGNYRTGEPTYPPDSFRSYRPVIDPDALPRRIPPESPPPSPPTSPPPPVSPNSSTASDDTAQTQIDTTKLAKDLEAASLTVSPSSSVEVGADAVYEVDGSAQSKMAQPGVSPKSSMSVNSSKHVDEDNEIEDAVGPSTSATPSINVVEPSTSKKEGDDTDDGITKLEEAGPSDPNKKSETVQNSRAYAVATLDGTIMLVQDEVILWAFQVDHQMFGLHKVDLNDDQLDEIVCCAWDGQVYMLDQHKTVVKFNLGEPVKAFACGMFSGEKERSPMPAFAFVTFNQRLYIYYDIKIVSMAIRRFDPDITAIYPVFMEMENLTEEEAIHRVRSMTRKEKAHVMSVLVYTPL